MCGIFAYSGRIAPDPRLLTAIAQAAGSRGPHAHGWTTGNTTHHALGPLDPAAAVAAGQSACRILGHARLATVGRHDDPDGIQPVAAAGHHMAFNGNVYNAHEVHPGSWPTDTHHLAEAYAAHRAAGHDPAGALERALAPARMRAWAVVVLDATGALVTHRHSLPLFAHRTDSGLYLASRAFHPEARPVPENTITSEEPT